MHSIYQNLPKIYNRKTGRVSSWDPTGRNDDYITIQPGHTVTLAELNGPAQITHIWMTQWKGYRECLLKVTYDHASYPSIYAPLGDFFCLGHGMVNSFQSALFTASSNYRYIANRGCALNCYAPMPFHKHIKIELENQSTEVHEQYYYIDYETLPLFEEDTGYFHAEFHRANPFPGWGKNLGSVSDQVMAVANTGRQAWDNNYIILQTTGRGHYIGCNLSVTNFTGDWWGEGDDMIWVDGYKWSPDLHGTGSEDYFGHAGGMQSDTTLYGGSSIFEGHTVPVPQIELWRGSSGYQTSYIFHIENPIRFTREIKVTIESGHANHMANEMASVAYWYAQEPTAVTTPPPLADRKPLSRIIQGEWLNHISQHIPGPSHSTAITTSQANPPEEKV